MSTTPTHEAFTWISPFKHTRGYTFMCSTSHLYIHTRHFLPVSLKFRSNDDFVNTATNKNRADT